MTSILFPECMIRRGGPEDQSTGEDFMNGQRCHRIHGHGGDCLFDQAPEFEAPRNPIDEGRLVGGPRNRK